MVDWEFVRFCNFFLVKYPPAAELRSYFWVKLTLIFVKRPSQGFGKCLHIIFCRLCLKIEMYRNLRQTPSVVEIACSTDLA
jgi:hypothetical protein